MGGGGGKEAEARAARDNTTRHSPLPPLLRLPRVLPLLGRYIDQEGGGFTCRFGHCPPALPLPLRTRATIDDDAALLPPLLLQWLGPVVLVLCVVVVLQLVSVSVCKREMQSTNDLLPLSSSSTSSSSEGFFSSSSRTLKRKDKATNHILH